MIADCSPSKRNSEIKVCGAADDMNQNQNIQMDSEVGQLADVEK
jgi:hypothetical protein